MRVLMTTDAVGGVWQYSLALARGLIELFNCRVLLVSFGEPNRDDLAEAIPTPGVSLTSLDFKLEWMPNSSGDIQAAQREIGKIAREWHADVIHGSQYCVGSIDSPTPKVVVAHSDLLGWIAWHRGDGEVDFDAIESDPALRAYRDIVSLGLAGAAAVVCPSRFIAKHIDEAYGCPSEMIYNGLWADLYHSSAKNPTAAVTGRLWDEAKMAAVAVEGVSGLPIELQMIGPTVGPTNEKASLPGADNVSYLGRLDWKLTREAVGSASYYLATSSYEPFGLSVLEAALSGCAIIANDIPSFREIWKDTVVYYRRNDPADLRIKLTHLLERPEESAKLGKAARTKALESYTGQRMATKYYRLYREL